MAQEASIDSETGNVEVQFSASQKALRMLLSRVSTHTLRSLACEGSITDSKTAQEALDLFEFLQRAAAEQ